ncbi:MAG: ComF family protein [Acidobacteria bacterium]|nr:ComF family protein [Acidobacteriota bacterium]
MFNAIFPEDCRICDQPLREVHRYPVCPTCLSSPLPLESEYACAACHMPFVTRHPLDENGLCLLCRRGLTGFDGASSYGFYEGTLRKLIHLYKYHGVDTLAGPLANFLVAALPRHQQVDWIVPVPMHWFRRWRRGYNQSELLARELSRRTGIPMLAALRRQRRTPPQAGLSDKERRQNLRGAFAVIESPRNRHVLLIDDVLTTGATASACGAALKLAGASAVQVLTVARVDRRLSVTALQGRAISTTASGG